MKYILFSLILVLGQEASAQKYKSTKSKVYFFSTAPVEDIQATNKKSSSMMDLEHGNIVFSVPVKQFVFAKSLMKQHFNENYLESDEYPKIIFIGLIKNTDLREGENLVTVEGDLELHGVKKRIEVQGTITVEKKSMVAHAEFPIKLADYNIKIPKAVFYNIAEVIDVTVDFTYEPY